MTDSRKAQDNLQLAETVAREAGKILLETRRQGDIKVDSRELHDVKLAADKASEDLIINKLREERPEDGIISEECGASETQKEGIWIIDPLDGTVNFSHGHPHFCVSIAWCRRGEVQAGVVYDPVREELFSALRDGGAYCNGEPIDAAATNRLEQAMLAVGFGNLPGQESLRQMEKLSERVQKLRISGSAALDLAYVACGRLDGYCETRIFVWDLAAGLLIAREAGAIGYMWPGGKPWRRGCLAAAPGLIDAAAQVLQFDPQQANAEWTIN